MKTLIIIFSLFSTSTFSKNDMNLAKEFEIEQFDLLITSTFGIK
tara:strand:+ start:18 stop:149 length:132 start_codon:yes stop_codon:yes gene_type:complete